MTPTTIIIIKKIVLKYNAIMKRLAENLIYIRYSL